MNNITYIVNFLYLFQSFALIEDKSVKDNLLLAMYFSRDRNKIVQIESVLQKLGLSSKMYSLVRSLLGGEKQRVALARILLKPGKIILADEPTGALDPELANIAFNLLFQLSQEYHKTVVMVTHNMEQARAAERIISLK